MERKTNADDESSTLNYLKAMLILNKKMVYVRTCKLEDNTSCYTEPPV